MRSRLTISLALPMLCACTLYAQQAAAPEPGAPEAVIIPVKTLTGDSFDRLVRLLGVFNAKYTADSQLRTIVVYAPRDVVTQMRRVIEELDKPGSEAAIGRNIEMTLTLLRCSTKAPGAASALPPEIEAVARQLRAATQYKDIQLWDVVPLRLQEGKDMTETLRLPAVGLREGVTPPTGNFLIRAEAVGRKGTGRYVRFARLQFNFKIPVLTGTAGSSPLVNTQFIYQDIGLSTAGDFYEGQKTVLGKVSGTDDESAIFVVIALKVLD